MLRYGHLSGPETFIALRTHVTKRGVQPPSVVESFQILKDGKILVEDEEALSAARVLVEME